MYITSTFIFKGKLPVILRSRLANSPCYHAVITNVVAFSFTQITSEYFFSEAPSYFWNKVGHFECPVFFQQFYVVCVVFVSKRFVAIVDSFFE